MSIGNRVDEAYMKLLAGDLENALIQLSIAIDATAKKKFNNEKKVGKRVKSFVSEYEDLITHLSMAGQLRIFATEGVSYGDKGDLGEVLYKSIRCDLLHEADISNQVVFKSGAVTGMENGKFIVTDQLLWGLLLILVGDKTNSNQTLKQDHKMTFNGKNLDLNSLWGNLDGIKKATGYLSPQELGVPI
ncbi:MAG: hypothetical protein L3K24_06335 [Gammaproteobacteria bacterium]|nr:hypothetical protein [Gammaproteobacteria bacterium]